jgi:hypothetical protein
MNFIEYYKYNKKNIIKQFNEMINPNLSKLLELFKNANKMLIELSNLNDHHFFDDVANDFIEELKSRLYEGPILESFDEHSVIWYTTEIGQQVFYKTDHRILDIAWKNYKITYLWLEQMKLDSVNYKRKYDLIESNNCEMKVDSNNIDNIPNINNQDNLDKCEIKHIMNINNYKAELETI